MNLNEQFSKIAAAYPNRTAYIFKDEKVSYRVFEQQVKQFAQALRQMGYKQGDHIALVLWNSPNFIIALYAVFQIGAVVIPINPMYKPNEIKYILRDAKVKLVITMDQLLDVFEEIHQELPDVRHYIFGDSDVKVDYENSSLGSKVKLFHEVNESGTLNHEVVFVNDKDTVMLLYTSGTTGKPKGTMLSMENVYANARNSAEHLQYEKNDIVIAMLPMIHVFGLGAALAGPLLKGAAIAIVPKFSPREVFRIAKTYRATVLAGVPTMYNYLLQTAENEPYYKDHFSSIRLSISGGSSLPVNLLNQIREIFGLEITEGYGLSEAAPVAYNPVDAVKKPGSIGNSVENVEVKLVDDKDREVKVGEEGEIIVKGSIVMKGYYQMSEETQKTLKNGWLYTGDIARMDEEGYIFIVDRKKDVVIVSGYNVYPREIEEVLYNHPNVLEAAIIGESDEETGEEVIGYVSVNDESVTEEELIDYCHVHLADYKVPQEIRILDELPKNGIGKILKKELRKARC